MASKFNLSEYAVNFLASQGPAIMLLDQIQLDVYDGAQPATADDPLGINAALLATFYFPPMLMNRIEAHGTISFGPIADTTWKASGRVRFGRAVKGGIVIFDCSAGSTNENTDIIVNVNPVTEGAVAHIVASPTYTVAK